MVIFAISWKLVVETDGSRLTWLIYNRAKVTGMDINTVELTQARKVFAKVTNLKFSEGDIRSGILGDEKFDLIVFAASIQYFESLKEILKVAISI